MRRNKFEEMKGSMILMGLVSLILFACQPKSEYQKVKERELASGKVVEELFLDLRLGMGRKEFFGTCWELNKKGVLTNGAHHLQVQYKPQMPSGKEVLMHFYPQFEDNRLFFMPVELSYPSWFPGNEEYSNDKLLEDVLGLLNEWYGEGFFEVNNKEKTISAFVKIDGNRLIRVFKKDLVSVRVEMLDLRVKDISEINRKNGAA